MQIQQEETRDNVRFIWNVTPSTRVQQARSIYHPAIHYTPFGTHNKQSLKYIPLTCKCQAIHSKYSNIDFQQKLITCCICGLTSALPPNYAQHITPQKLPYQLMPGNSTFEYQTPTNIKSQHSPIYLFVIDLCISQKELSSIRQQIVKVVSELPNNVRVGLITFNKFIYVYELNSKLNTIFCINGTKEYNLNNIMEILGINVKHDPRMVSPETLKRFLVRIEQNRQKIIKRIQDIKVSQIIHVNGRPERATGQAINVAISISESSPQPTRIVLLVGGPCTVGPGIVISTDFKSQMRSAQQLSKGQNVPFFETATKYYNALSMRALNKKLIIDSFAFCVEETGMAQMCSLVNSTGGFIVMHEEFRDRIFKQSFRKLFSQHQPPQQEDHRILLVTQAIIFIYGSRQVSINGALGQCHSLNKNKTFVSEKQIGFGKTYAWYLGCLDKLKTITFLYETKEPSVKQQYFYIQFKTNYKNLEGVNIIRVTTLRRKWGESVEEIANGFDQQAAAVYLARYSMHKAIAQQQNNVRKWVDSTLCRWASYFANYIKNDMTSFTLPPNMRKMPQFVYHLRRSHFVNRFGCSLDESFYHFHLMNRQSVTNCLAMIQPALLKYTLENTQPQPVQLDEEEMQDEVILLLDSYFNIIEWYGSHIQSWYENKFHENPEYQHIAQLLESPKQDIDYIMATRFPVPNYYLAHPYHSKERYLKSRVNPKKSAGNQNENMLTDDSDIKSFTQHLVKVVVKQLIL